jgi:hypothetical protein
VICACDIGLKQSDFSTLNCSGLPEEASVNSPSTVKDIDTSTVFAPLSNLVGSHTANVSYAAWSHFNTVLQGFEEIANRLKNRRSDPFINRIE